MSEKTVQCVYYSASRTTQKILDKVAEGTGMKVLPPVDITSRKTREGFDGSVEGDLVLVGSPVYEGSVPSIATGPFLKMNGEGKWAVPIGVYGNRSAEDYVSELSGLLRGRGFKIIAGAEFIAEHSYTHEAVGKAAAVSRPDEADLEVAHGFGKNIAEKMISPDEAPIESKPLKFGDTHKDKATWRENRIKERITTPLFEESKCIQCNQCVEVCPTDAIDESSYATDSDACTRCMACVKVCPTAAKTISYPAPVTQFIKTWGEDRKEPKLIL